MYTALESLACGNLKPCMAAFSESRQTPFTIACTLARGGDGGGGGVAVAVAAGGGCGGGGGGDGGAAATGAASAGVG